MTDGPSADVTETLAALERLVHRHKAITPEQALAAARIITGNPEFEFQAPAPPLAPAPAPSPANNPSPDGSESL